MKTLIFTAGVAAIALASPAAAEPFEGPYVGAQAGYNHDSYEAVNTRAGQVAIDNGKDSFKGGVYIGYDHHLTDDFVIGAETGFDLAASDSVRSTEGNAIDPRHAFTATARAGFQPDSKTLLYVRGGYENANARVSYASESGTDRLTRSYDGWTAGGGVERYLTDDVSARLEYRYSELGGDDTHFHQHAGLFGVSYHF